MCRELRQLCFRAAAAAVGTAGAYDGLVTGIDSGVSGHYKPYGNIQAATRAAKTGKPGDVFDAVGGPVLDAAAGAGASKVGKARATKASHMKNLKRVAESRTKDGKPVFSSGTVLTEMEGKSGSRC